MQLNMHLQRFLGLQLVKNGSIKYFRNLHNLQKSKNLLSLFHLTNIYFDPCYFPSNLNSVNNFSTTKALLKVKCKEKKRSQSLNVNLNEIAEVINVSKMLSQFDNTIENFKGQLVKHVGLRTTTGAVEELVVEYDGEEYQLQELVEIGRKPKMIVMNVSRFPQAIPKIIETLSKSQMNLNPQQEGTTIYIPTPKVTKEHRENLAKRAKAFFVTCKDNITDIRNKYIKNVKKQENLPLDMSYRTQNYISTMSQEYIKKADEILQARTKELLREE